MNEIRHTTFNLITVTSRHRHHQFSRSQNTMFQQLTKQVTTTPFRTQAPLLRRSTPLLRRFYHEKVLDHYNKPRNVGSLPKNDIDVGTGLYFSSLIPTPSLEFSTLLLNSLCVPPILPFPFLMIVRDHAN